MDEEIDIVATRVEVLETHLLHVADQIFWLDGASHSEPALMRRLQRPVLLDIQQAPADLQFLHKAGRSACWRRPATDAIVAGSADQAQRSRPAMPPFHVSGQVRDSAGAYNPRRLSLSLGSGDGHAVVLYPSPAGVRWPRGGGLYGNLSLAASGAALPWALLELEVDLPGGGSLLFRAQADAHGDFSLPLNRLPPLPESISQYDAQLRCRAALAAQAGAVEDPEEFVAVELAALEEAGFAQDIPVSLRPGELRRVNSFNSDHLAVQAVD